MVSPPLPLSPTTYDELPYPSHPLPQSHPDHLATIATLLGLEPVSPSRCRVLELGCASGGNIIPMALGLPESSFVGIDLSGEQTAQALQMVEALGLKNVQVRQKSILDLDDAVGEFDYIICHGVYSWVPAQVQDKIVELCARHLAPAGVGYISYNTYPGWHMRGMLRDMMYYHVHRFPDESPAQNVGRARALLKFLARSAPRENSPYGLLLRQHLDLLSKHTDSYLFHEYLEERNEPIYFLEFCQRLTRQGLRYLGEAEFSVMVAGTGFPADVQDSLNELAPNLIEKEQYMDFLRNRTFRQTLVCHAQIQPNYEVRAERLAGLHVASSLRPVSPDLALEAPQEFKSNDDLTLTTSAPIVKAGFAILGDVWPKALAFRPLCQEARKRLSSSKSRGLEGSPDSANHETEQQDAKVLAKAILTAFATAGTQLVELSLRPPAFTTAISERPLASPLARLQARASNQVTNLRHQAVQLTSFDCHLLPLLDGTRNHSELVEGLAERVARGDLQITEKEAAVTDSARAREILAEGLQQQLPKLARSGLLLE